MLFAVHHQPEREPAIESAAAFIAPLATAARSEEIAARLSEAIHLGLIADGEQLPPEAEFARQLGVAIMTLRESISTLRERGLVETRRGRNGGTFVRRPPEPPEKPDLDRLLAASVSSLRDIADEQLAITGTAARLAAERAVPRSLRRIHTLVDQLHSATSRGGWVKADSRFHVEVAIASRSERLVRREVALQAETAGMLWLPHLSAQDREAIGREHHEIAARIAAEDADGAHQAAAHHVRANLRRLTTGHLRLIEAGEKGNPQ
ncbi:FadR/GntR family transcriptional regulator [Millisia brevis]|uniref:FadR/GntR family transcriptional regulator n=1 Tax=Millisia brevis TaxID=264148 RepID=UPI0008338C51|nr:FCD domain-containing protein [Millisia brevis]